MFLIRGYTPLLGHLCIIAMVIKDGSGLREPRLYYKNENGSLHPLSPVINERYYVACQAVCAYINVCGIACPRSSQSACVRNDWRG